MMFQKHEMMRMHPQGGMPDMGNQQIYYSDSNFSQQQFNSNVNFQNP